MFDFDDQEQIYGLGHQRQDSVNLRGHLVPLVQYNFFQPVPVLMSSKGYGVFVDEYAINYFDDREGKGIWHVDASSCANYYIILGDDVDELLAGYHELVGRLALFPKAIFGYVQSKERYKSQEELVEVVEEYRKRGVPLDVIVQDWKYWVEDKNGWGDKVFDNKRFPDPQGLVEHIHANHVKAMISIWPKLGETTENARDFQGKNALLPGGMYYDAIEKYIRLRYRLLPYIYSAAYRVSDGGRAMMYPLAVKFDDPKVKNENINYMFGDAFLVCPVLRHMYAYPAREKRKNPECPNTKVKVYLPAGCDWYLLENGARFAGGREVVVEAPIDTMPVFVKAGSIICENVGFVLNSTEAGDLRLSVWPGTDGCAVYYDDDGETLAYRKGEYIRWDVFWDDKARELAIDSKGRQELRRVVVRNAATGREKCVEAGNGVQRIVLE